MKSGKFFRRWRRQLSSLLDEISHRTVQCQKSGNVEDIHELRVALRRARVFSRLGIVVTGKRPVKQLTHWSQSLTAGLGNVRDLDITLAWLEDHPQATALIEACQRLRREAWQCVTENFTHLPQPLVNAFAKSFSNESAQKQLQKKYLTTINQLEALIHDQSRHLNRLSPEEQHQFRRTVRRYRYLMELGLPKRKQKENALIKRLIEFQKILGEMQDCVVVERVLPHLPALPPRGKLLKLVRTERKQWLLKSRRTIRGITKLKNQPD